MAELNAERWEPPKQSEPHLELARDIAEQYARSQPQCDVGGPGGAMFLVKVEPTGAVAYDRVIGDVVDCEALECVRKAFERMDVAHPPKASTYVNVPIEWSNGTTPSFAPNLRFAASQPLRCPTKKPKVSGHLEPVEIQKVVRGNFDRMRACYEKGLAEDPKLEGRVSMRFVIDREGKVPAAAIGELTLPQCEVARCVRDVFKTLQFPKPEGGIVSVTYPIMFSPSE